MKVFDMEVSGHVPVKVTVKLINLVDPEVYTVGVMDGQLERRIGMLSARKGEYVGVVNDVPHVITVLEAEGELPVQDRDNLVKLGAEKVLQLWYAQQAITS